MKKRLISIALMLAMVLASVSLVGCDIFGFGDIDETTAEAESTKGGSSSSPEGDENEAPTGPLTEKTAEELFAVIESYLESFGDRCFTVTQSQTIDGLSYVHEGEARLDRGAVYEVAIKGYGTNNPSMIFNLSETSDLAPKTGEAVREIKIENYTLVDGSIYLYAENNGKIQKLKAADYEGTDIFVEDFVEMSEDITESVFLFGGSSFISLSVSIVDSTYVLNAVGLSKELFAEIFLGIDSDDDQSRLDRYIFDPDKDYSMTVVFDGKCRIVSAEASYSFRERYETGDKVLLDYTSTNKIRFESSFGTPNIVPPADVDEYLPFNDSSSSGEPEAPAPQQTEPTETTVSYTEPVSMPEQGVPPSPMSADDLYAMLERYFTLEGNPTYELTKETSCKFNDTTTVSIEKSTLVINGFGEKNASLLQRREDDDTMESLLYVDGYAYISSLYYGEEYYSKMKMSIADFTATASEGDMVYDLPFTFDELLSAEVCYENGNYVISIVGVTKEAYVREILNLDGGIAMDLAKQYYKFTPEDYHAMIVLTADGRLVSYETRTQYTLIGEEEIGMVPGIYHYEVTEKMTALYDTVLSAPADADRYPEEYPEE